MPAFGIQCGHDLVREDQVSYECCHDAGHAGDHWNKATGISWPSRYRAQWKLPASPEADPLHGPFNLVRCADALVARKPA